MKLKTFFLTIFVFLKRRSIALTLTVGLLFTVASIQLLGQSRAYVANFNSFTVSVIDTDLNTEVDLIRVGGFPIAVAITPDGSRAYVANVSSFTVSVIDTDLNREVDLIRVGSLPAGIAITP